MKNNVKILNNTKNSNILDIFEYISSLNLISFLSFAELKCYASDEYIKKFKFKKNNEWQEYISSIKDYDFLDPDNYKAPVDDYVMSNLSNFRDIIIAVIEQKYNTNRESFKLSRLVSPPLSAYKYIGHSIDIKPTGKNYGFLFE